MTPDEVRKFLDTHRPEDYHLVDVRQSREYERMHLPGAMLIPLAELSGRIAGLDQKKPVIVY
jgi:rhodanese-related sulfurtransferase